MLMICAMPASVFAKHSFKYLRYSVDFLNTMSLAEDSSGRSVDGAETVRANSPIISTPPSQSN